MPGLNETVRFAVIGCGHIGKRHAAAVQQVEGAQLAALIDINERGSLQIENFDAPFFPSLEALFETDTGVDTVIIATPNGLHASHALKALHARKHVVIEKPMTLNAEEGKQIIAKAAEMGRRVFPVMQNRYSPPAKWLKQIVEEGRLGKIFMVQLNCYWNRDDRYYKKGGWHGTRELDGGTLFTQFSHFVDILFWVFGDIENINSRLVNFNHRHLTEFEDSGVVNFDLKSGGIGSLHFSTSVWDRNMESSITVLAENGSVKIGGQYMDKVSYCHIRDYTLPELPNTNLPNQYSGYQGSAQNHHYVLENVVEVLLRKTMVHVKAEEGLQVVDMIERMYKAG